METTENPQAFKAFQVAIRGIPDFSHLQYLEVGSFDEIFSLFAIKAREGWSNDRVEIYTKENKRVLIYIDHTLS